MPLFQYRCKVCGQVFEKFVLMVSFRDKPQECPKCGSKESERLEFGNFSSRSGNSGGSSFTGSCGPFT